MIKICHITSAHYAEDTRVFHKECVSLVKEGYDVYIVAKGKTCDKNGVHIVGIGEITGGRINRMLNVTKQVYKKALEIDADIYHFHDPELLSYGLKLKKKGKKVIFDSHENTVDQIHEKDWIPNFIRKPMYFFFDRFQKKVCKEFDAIVSVSPHICDYFKKTNNNVVMITNYPDYVEYFTEDKINNKKICFAGGISKQWNHHNIIKALDDINDVTYVLCGDGKEDYITELKSLSSWNKVDYKGVIQHEEVAKILSECDIGMSILSYNRNTGGKIGTLGNTKIYEEMMAGLPIICTDFILWKEMIEKYHCGICVNPENVKEISNAITYLLNNPQIAKEMSENGRRAVRDEFNWGIEEKKLFKLYENILND